MSRRTVVFVDHATAFGGAEVSLLLLLRHLDRTRFTPHCICPRGPLADAVKALGIAVYEMDLLRLKGSLAAWATLSRGAGRIARLAHSLPDAVLVANTVRAAFYTACAALLARRPFVWYVRDFWLSEEAPKRPWFDRWGKRFLCAAATHLIANSHATASHLPCAGKVTVIHNGIDVEHYIPSISGAAFRKGFAIPAQAPLVGTVGRLRPWKGHHRFLEAMARVARQRPDARFVVVGGTPFNVKDDYPQRLERLAAALGLTGRVVFTGHLADVRPALAAMDVFVHAGDPEPFGLVVVEAMAMAKPVVAFAHGALPEIVVHRETGILVPPGDVEALAQGVLHLLQDRPRAEAMGRNGRQRVETHFAVQRTVRAFERVIDAIT